MRNFFEKIIKVIEEDIVNFVFNNLNKIKNFFYKRLHFFWKWGILDLAQTFAHINMKLLTTNMRGAIMKKRQSGVLMHISSLPGAYGIG